MTATETAAWQDFTIENMGQWVVDPIHNGQDGRDLVISKSDVLCIEDGVYVTITATGWHSGAYTGAYPHLGEARFTVTSSNEAKSFAEACANAAISFPHLAQFIEAVR